MGMPTLLRIIVGAAPVPPRRPSMATMSAPARTMPLAMGATLCTAAILTETGLLVVGGLLEGVDELAQVLDGVDVVVRRRREASVPSGIMRVREMSRVTFSPGRCPPMPGLAPWPILISSAAAAFRYSGCTPKRPEATWTMVLAPYS